MASECGHGHSGHGLSGRALSEALEAAGRRCARTGQRLTEPRLRALELLLQSGGPLKPYDLIARFGRDGSPAKPPTVYRALEFLEREGFAHRVESLNAYVACAMGEDAHAAAFLICDCCGGVEETEPAGAPAVRAAALAQGFTVRSLTVEARGRCRTCGPEAESTLS